MCDHVHTLRVYSCVDARTDKLALAYIFLTISLVYTVVSHARVPRAYARSEDGFYSE